MTAEEVRIKAQLMTGATIDVKTSLDWVRDGVNAIVTMRYNAGVYTREDININDPTLSYKLSKPVARIIKIVSKSDPTAILDPSTDYSMYGDNNITINAQGKYVVHYYAFPEVKEIKGSNEVELPKVYQDALPYYVAAKIRGRYMGQTDNDTIYYQNQFDQSVAEAYVHYSRQNSRGRRMPPSAGRRRRK